MDFAKMELKLTPEKQNKAMNAGLLILACFMAFKIYQGNQAQAKQFILQKESEFNKSMTITSINALGKKIASLKALVNDKDTNALINTINSLVSDKEVKIVALKPLSEESTPLFTEYPFSLTATATSFEDIGKLISRLENSPHIFVVKSLSVSSFRHGEEKDRLSLDLKFCTYVLK